MEQLILEKDSTYTFSKPLCVAIGVFDGIHLAHQALLNQALENGRKKNYLTGVITFDPHPDFILNPEIAPTYIQTQSQKMNKLNQMGFDYCFIIPFSKKIASLSPMDFVHEFLVKMGVKDVVVGFDFCFGDRGSGHAKDIEELSGGVIHTTILEKMEYHHHKIGSKLIRDYLKDGRVEDVKTLLGTPFSIVGQVVPGSHLGRTMNLATANIHYAKDYPELKQGVYGTKVHLSGKTYNALTNIGHNPSFNYQKEAILETHLLDYSGDCYFDELTVDFYFFVRDEITFSSKEDFLSQIDKDKKYILEHFQIKSK